MAVNFDDVSGNRLDVREEEVLELKNILVEGVLSSEARESKKGKVRRLIDIIEKERLLLLEMAQKIKLLN